MPAIKGMKHAPKVCLGCHEIFTPTGCNSKFCLECAALRTAWSRKVSISKTGAGSGGKNLGKATRHNYRYFYATRLYIKQHGLCKHCLESFLESELVIHHKDANRNNNVETNLELVCRQCHQIEHECWLAFSKV